MPPLTRYIQFSFEFSADRESGISLDYLEFDFASLFVGRGVVAEIFPDTTISVGVSTPFQYVLKPIFKDRRDAGFNRINLAMPSLDAQLDSLLVDDLLWRRLLPEIHEASDKAWLDSVTITDGHSYAVAVYRDSASEQVTMAIKTRELGADDFPVSSAKDIRLVFNTPVFKLLTKFDSWIWNDRTGDILLQPVDPGNAVDQLPSDRTSVTVHESQELLSVRTIGPNPFTPNGDGINDVIQFNIGIYLITGAVEAHISIFTLAGDRVRQFTAQNCSAGAFRWSWDGRNDVNEAVAPGLYTYRLVIDSDHNVGAELNGTIAVAY